MGKFIVVGNSYLPVNTKAERALAGRAVAKQANETNIESSRVYEGSPGFADDTNLGLTAEGLLIRFQ